MSEVPLYCGPKEGGHLHEFEVSLCMLNVG